MEEAGRRGAGWARSGGALVNALVVSSRRSSEAGKTGRVSLPDRKQSSGGLELAVEAGGRGTGEGTRVKGGGSGAKEGEEGRGRGGSRRRGRRKMAGIGRGGLDLADLGGGDRSRRRT